MYIKLIESWHVISNNVVCATSKASDQPAHTRSLIRAFASRLNIPWVLSYRLASFGVSKLNRRLHRLIWFYTCQNAKLLDITCRCSINFWLVYVACIFAEWPLDFYRLHSVWSGTENVLKVLGVNSYIKQISECLLGCSISLIVVMPHPCFVEGRCYSDAWHQEHVVTITHVHFTCTYHNVSDVCIIAYNYNCKKKIETELTISWFLRVLPTQYTIWMLIQFYVCIKLNLCVRVHLSSWAMRSNCFFASSKGSSETLQKRNLV